MTVSQVIGPVSEAPYSAKDLELLEDIVAAAGEVAKSYFESRAQFDVQEKSPGQFVTEADTNVESIIREKLGQSFGVHPIIGEEFGGSFEGTGWVIDPIDGTSNFLCGLPFWGVSVGFMENGAPVIGCVYLPALDLLVSARRGAGVRVNREQAPTPTPPCSVPTVAVGENQTWSEVDTDAAGVALRAKGFDVLRLRGASACLALSAIGRIDGYVERHLKIWDIAAGTLLCQEAGLNVDVEVHGGNERSVHVFGAADVRS